jgi:hypothetical protein
MLLLLAVFVPALHLTRDAARHTLKVLGCVPIDHFIQNERVMDRHLRAAGDSVRRGYTGQRRTTSQYRPGLGAEQRGRDGETVWAHALTRATFREWQPCRLFPRHSPSLCRKSMLPFCFLLLLCGHTQGKKDQRGRTGREHHRTTDVSCRSPLDRPHSPGLNPGAPPM